MDILWKILTTLGLVAVNACFVAAEFAAVSARLSRLEGEANKRFTARVALDIKRRLDLFLSSCQLGNTLASLALGAVTEPAIAGIINPLFSLLGIPESHRHLIAFAVAMLISTSLHIILGEQVPKNWSIRHSDRILEWAAIPLVIFTYLFFPLIWLLNWATNGVLTIMGMSVGSLAQGAVPHTEDELKGLLAQAVAHGTISKGHQEILTSAFDFTDLKARQIMTPRTAVDYLLLDQPIGEVLRIVQKAAYTRLPLCKGDIDHVIGIIHMKDLFAHLKLAPGKLRFTDDRGPHGETIAIADGLPGSKVHVIGAGDIDLREIMREVLFVPELLPVPKLLRQFQAGHGHMGIVVDEYGATLGLVTMEDVLEEIVGEIEDEFDIASPAAFVMEGDHFRVNGLYPLHELRERLHVPDTDGSNEAVATVSGYVVQQLNHWPRPGEIVRLGDYQIKVVSVQKKRVSQVLVSPMTPQATGADEATSRM